MRLELDLLAFAVTELGEEERERSLGMALSASDLPAIYSLLTNSMSGDERVRKPAETALGQSENRPGFCSCLMVLSPPLLLLLYFVSLPYIFATVGCSGNCFLKCCRGR